MILLVGEETTELIFTVREAPQGQPYELSEIVEKAKTKAGGRPAQPATLCAKRSKILPTRRTPDPRC